MGGACLCPCCDDAVAELIQRACDATLVRHAGIGGPPDVYVAVLPQHLEGAGAVQHDGNRIHTLRPAMIAQLPTGGDRDGIADGVQRDRMARRQYLKRGAVKIYNFGLLWRK